MKIFASQSVIGGKNKASSLGNEFEERIRRLERALLDNVSHELKTPLTIIRNGLDQEEIDRAEMAQAVRRLERTVEDLLFAARIDAGELKVSPEWCDPSELTRACVSTVHPEDHQIRVQIGPSLPFLFVDPQLVERLLIILLVNAVAHSSPADVVELQVVGDSQSVTWSVLDRGPQFSDGKEANVFAKFYRDVRRFTDGLLGLWIARRLVEMHEGEIVARNRPGGGAEFSVRFPLRESLQLPPDTE